MTHSYSEILSRLLNVNLSGGMKLGLHNCLQLDYLLKHPSRAFPAIHIAGTNGKGSVSTKIAAAYQAMGLKTGLYTSPHISCFRERIRINGQMVTEEQVLEHLSTLFSIAEKHEIKATFFELTTMLAFLFFSAEKVDIAVLETGLGGRLDATNIANPILSIITSISLEHTEILGNTIEAIAYEKAGIIKSGIPVLIGPRVPKSVIEKVAIEMGSPLMQIEGVFPDYHAENCAIAKQALNLETAVQDGKVMQDFELEPRPAGGDHSQKVKAPPAGSGYGSKDCINLPSSTAVSRLKYLEVPVNAIQRGLNALPPCRLETFTDTHFRTIHYPTPWPQAVILDVAHNPDGLKHLIQAVRIRYPSTPLRFVLGLSSNKDVLGCLQVIKGAAVAFHLVEGTNGRAAPKTEVEKHLKNLAVEESRIFCEASIKKGVHHASQIAGNNHEVVVVCGTFFIMGEARQALGIKEPHDPQDMNERKSFN